MATMNVTQLREELCNFIRYSDVLSTTIRGVTRVTSSYVVGVGGESSHTFTGNTPIRDIKTLTVNSVAKYYLRDYTLNFTTGALTWNTPLVETDTVAYVLDYGTGDKIYPDLPRDDLSLDSFPRIGIELTNISTNPLGLGGASHISDILITIILWLPVNKVSTVAGGFGGLNDAESTMKLIRDAIRTNAKSFYTFSWITPKGRGPVTKSTNNKLMQISSDFLIKYKIE